MIFLPKKAQQLVVHNQAAWLIARRWPDLPTDHQTGCDTVICDQLYTRLPSYEPNVSRLIHNLMKTIAIMPQPQMRAVLSLKLPKLTFNRIRKAMILKRKLLPTLTNFLTSTKLREKKGSEPQCSLAMNSGVVAWNNHRRCGVNESAPYTCRSSVVWSPLFQRHLSATFPWARGLLACSSS